MASSSEKIKGLFKKYGKIALGVHLCVYGTFLTGCYIAIDNHVDVRTPLQKIGLLSKEKYDDAAAEGAEAEAQANAQNKGWMDKVLSGGSSTLALAFLCNKALFPVRTPITLGLTPLVARALRYRAAGGKASTQTPAASQQGAWTPAAAACRQAGPHRRAFSARELFLANERYRAWKAGRSKGIAFALAVKGQHEDLAEWLQYHSQLGVDHFYVYDTGSKPPLDTVLQPFIEEGLVTYIYLDDFAAAAKRLTASNDHRYRPKFKQWIVYSMCLRDYGARHRWMAFIDSDEFLVLTDGTPSLPALLADYEDRAGLVLNWRILGSSGHKQRQNSTLLAYTSCYQRDVDEQLATKSIINPALTVQPPSPHNAFYYGGCHAVQTDGTRVDTFASDRVADERLIIYHYITKSQEDFDRKMARGDGMGRRDRKQDYFDNVQQKATEQCTLAAQAWRRMQQQQWQGSAAAGLRPKGGDMGGNLAANQ
ncbi:glycosyl transferase family 2 [Chlorella sorokiniana]|uniref:Glycosyltransferase family 92 protein n=1 Tax=Chlorella sorokiniana TaxID=3076 RepID=A0A2P6U0V8_CHLSO|nr:glycosyl transferase family 2 [Chlorella sorokiniana]|eukprot:PRW59940.1 glycosyl transferase family 2 [Chlorella sorokiniana]